MGYKVAYGTDVMEKLKRRKMWLWCACALATALAATFTGKAADRRMSRIDGAQEEGWPQYGHNAGGMRYSPLKQTTRENVASLKVACTFHTGDISDGEGRRKRSGYEPTPLMLDSTLYLSNPFNRLIA